MYFCVQNNNIISNSFFFFIDNILNSPTIVAEKKYSLRPIFFILFEKSIFLRKHHLLSCLLFKNV